MLELLDFFSFPLFCVLILKSEGDVVLLLFFVFDLEIRRECGVASPCWGNFGSGVTLALRAVPGFQCAGGQSPGR